MRKQTKLILDVGMLLGMMFSMSLQRLGPGIHKAIGLATLLLFLIHNLQNRKWYAALGRGRYTPMRTALTLTNILVGLALVGVMVSGVMLSKEMAQGLDGMTTGRMLHNVSSYISSGGMALHIGVHLRRRKSHDD